MRTDISIALSFDSGADLRLTVSSDDNLDRDDRVVVANLLHGIEMRLVCATPDEAEEEASWRREAEVDTEVGHLRRENAELRALVAQIPPGSMIGVPPPAAPT